MDSNRGASMKIELVVGDILRHKADMLVVNLFEGVKTPGGATGAVDAAIGGAVTAAVRGGGFPGEGGGRRRRRRGAPLWSFRSPATKTIDTNRRRRIAWSGSSGSSATGRWPGGSRRASTKAPGSEKRSTGGGISLPPRRRDLRPAGLAG